VENALQQVFPNIDGNICLFLPPVAANFREKKSMKTLSGEESLFLLDASFCLNPLGPL
jgi:hypothetical protein